MAFVQKILHFVVYRSSITLGLVLLITFGLAFGVQYFQLDASSDTLLLEDDDDLKFYRDTNKTFGGGGDFLIVTYSPFDELFTQETLTKIEELSDELEELEEIDSVLNFLDVPLLESPRQSISEIASNPISLRKKNVDLSLAKKEFSSNPVYRGLLVSEQLDTVALQAILKPATQYDSKIQERYRINEDSSLSEIEKQLQLDLLSQEIDVLQKENVATRKKLVADTRAIISKYKNDAEIYLGGGPMISTDTIQFILNDIVFFGFAVGLLFITVLGFIFRQIRWILLPLISAFISAIVVTGLISFAGLKVTVVSANYIALLMIIAISLTMHLVVRYQELLSKNSELSQKEIVLMASTQMFVPCLYTALTTIVAFLSLIVSDIKPITDFGLLMATSIVIAFLVTFSFFPAVISKLPKKEKDFVEDQSSGITLFIFQIFKNSRIKIIFFSLIVFGLSVLGISMLSVENKFIDYFKSDTEIYKGLSLIDQKLGGTAPLDLVINAPMTEQIEDDFEDFDDPFGMDDSTSGYWFTSQNLDRLEEIHDYLESRTEIGKVLSVSSGIKLAEIANGKKLNDLELAFMRELLPEDIKESLLNSYISDDDNQVRLQARVKESLDGLNRKNLIDEINYDLENKFGLDDQQFRLTGISVIYNNLLQSLFSSLIGSVGIVFIAIFVMFLFLFRSVSLALIGMIPNFLAAGFVMGSIGFSGVPLDIMTVTVAAISIGIGVDNTIHYLHRFKREFDLSKDYEECLKNSHTTIGRAMFYTSSTIVIGFLILLSSNFNPSVFFGIFTSLAMIMAILGSLLLLPTLLYYLKPLK
nr:MAG: membrane protein [Gammaproteobacteria bacterium]